MVSVENLFGMKVIWFVCFGVLVRFLKLGGVIMMKLVMGKFLIFGFDFSC